MFTDIVNINTVQGKVIFILRKKFLKIEYLINTAKNRLS